MMEWKIKMKLNEMKSINKTLTEEFKAKEIQSLSFFFGNAN